MDTNKRSLSRWLKGFGSVLLPQPTPDKEGGPSESFFNFPALSQITSMDIESKTFDWQHYMAVTQGGISGQFQAEFDATPTIRVLKSLFLQEPWVNICMNAIARQFLNVNLAIKKQTNEEGDVQLIKKHPLLKFLNFAGIEDSSFFTSNNIIDTVLCGNNYWYISKDLKDKRRLPAERVDPQITKGKLTGYRIMDTADIDIGKQQLTLLPEEVVHIKYPNPFSSHVGLSMIIALSLPVLIDKYGREYIVGFFLRGGNTSGIIETDTTNADQLLRFAKTLMQAFGGRRNMHADKILPKGTKWVGQGNTFEQIKLTEMLKENYGLFRAATGCTNTVLGQVENVNRATAFAEMQQFWKMTILPIQGIYCKGIMHSPLWERFGLDETNELCFDNSNIEWLNEFDVILDQDLKLVQTHSINERRIKLGAKPIERFGDKLYIELESTTKQSPLMFSFPQNQDVKSLPESTVVPVIDVVSEWKSLEKKLQEPTSQIEKEFTKEFGAWEGVVLSHINNKDAAEGMIKSRSESFASGFSELIIPTVMLAYENQLKRIKTKSFRAIQHKESPTDPESDRRARLDLLKDRAKALIQKKILAGQKESFLGYSKTAMDRVYKLIDDELAAGKSIDDVAYSVRQKFSEFYEGQARTIVGTEYSSAIAIGQQQFAEDLGTVAKKISKEWITMDDKWVREDHQALSGRKVYGESEKVNEALFSTEGDVDVDSGEDGNYLKYPKETGGDASMVVNCRCTIIHDVIEWKE